MPWLITSGETEVSDISNVVTKEEANTIYVNQAGDVMTGNLNMNNNKLVRAELQDCVVTKHPDTGTQLVNKDYLDNRLTGLDTIYVNESGDTLEGPLRMSRNKITGLPVPTDDSDAVNKKYVDTSFAKKTKSHFTLEQSALFMNKPIMMQTNKITALEQPTDDDDAATKKYVDQQKQSIMPFRIRIRINNQFQNILQKDINIPTIQNVDQVYVTATLHLSQFMAYMSIEKTINGPRGEPNKLTIKFTLTTLPRSATRSILGNVVIEGMIYVSTPSVNVGTLELEDELTRRLPEFSQESFVLTEESQRALNL